MAVVTLAPAPTLAPATRLWVALAAVLVALLLLAVMDLAMQRRVTANVERFNVFPQPDKLIGAAVPRAVFRRPDLLPVYGSSELSQPQYNRADLFFGHHPTGFGAFLIGNPGETALMIATKLAAIRPDAPGKKIVVFLSPGSFLVPELDHPGFGVNFSPLYAGIFAFESPLSASLKQALARRLLDYPEIISQSPLLDRALRDLATDTPAAYDQLAVLAPLGALLDQTLRESDYAKLTYWWWLTDGGTRVAPAPAANDQPPPPVAPPIDWEARINAADLVYSRRPALTAYSTGPRTGFDNFRAQLFHDKQHPEESPDEVFARKCAESKEWTDLQLVLRTAQEKNLQVLLVCQPINVKFSEIQGLTARSRTLLYDRLRQIAATFRVPFDLSAAGGDDPHAYSDCIHPSAKAWLTYDRLLDEFYQGNAPAAGS